MFAADASGSGLAAANIQRIKANGQQSYEDVAGRDGTGKIVARPIDLSASDEQVYLLLYGIGTRLRSGSKTSVARLTDSR
ncbi:MAG: hypothetical protein U0Y68_14100 [Blastocatellia bacterium]